MVENNVSGTLSVAISFGHPMMEHRYIPDILQTATIQVLHFVCQAPPTKLFGLHGAMAKVMHGWDIDHAQVFEGFHWVCSVLSPLDLYRTALNNLFGIYIMTLVGIPNQYKHLSLIALLQEPCREIIQFARAEWKNVQKSGGRPVCPVLTALRNANLKKSEPLSIYTLCGEHQIYVVFFCFNILYETYHSWAHLENKHVCMCMHVYYAIVVSPLWSLGFLVAMVCPLVSFSNFWGNWSWAGVQEEQALLPGSNYHGEPWALGEISISETTGFLGDIAAAEWPAPRSWWFFKYERSRVCSQDLLVKVSNNLSQVQSVWRLFHWCKTARTMLPLVFAWWWGGDI